MLKCGEYDSTSIFISTKTPHEEKDINSVYCYGGEKGETYSELIQKYEDPLMWSFDLEDDLVLDCCKYYDSIAPNFLIFYKDNNKYFIDLGYVYKSIDDDGWTRQDDYEYLSDVCKTIELTDYRDNIYKHFFTKWEEIKQDDMDIWEYEVLKLGQRNYDEDKEDAELDNEEWIWDYIDMDNKTIRYRLCYEHSIRFKDNVIKNEMMKEYVKIYTRRLVDNVRLFVSSSIN